MKYVLIFYIVILGNYEYGASSVSLTKLEFESKQLCEAARFDKHIDKRRFLTIEKSVSQCIAIKKDK